MPITPATPIAQGSSPSGSGSASGSASGSGPGRGPAGAMEREEIAGDARRVGQISRYALPVWIGFFVSDVVLAKAVYDASLVALIACRLAGVAVIGSAALITARRPPATRGGITAFVGLLGLGVAILIGVLAALLGGLASPYLAGVAFPLVAFGLLQRRARDSLPALMITAIGYPIGLLVAGADVRAQLAQSANAVVFGAQVALLLALAGFASVLSHYGWTLRRALFESRSIGRYQLKKRLGRGGMGEVWSAFHVTMRRNVAVKILRPERTDEAAVQRFEREVRATSELTHPHTVRVFDYGVTEDGLWYYAMELLDGVTLARLVAAQGPVTPARAVHFVAAAARALGEAHRHGIVHRDLKPDNLVVINAGDEPDFVKVIDFGIARQEGDPEAEITRAGLVAGTPTFMAPEVAAGRRADPRADVYSLGAVFYFLLVGAPPFSAESPAALMLAHINDPVVPPGRRMNAPLAEDVESIVLRCLAKAPEDRPADCGALATELAACTLYGVWRPQLAPPYPPANPPLATAATAPALASLDDVREPSDLETAIERPVRRE